MIRKKKKYSRPRKLYDKVRIEEENKLLKNYGLKNKKEIWKADSAIGRIRNQAKKLITASEEKKQVFLEKQNKMGFKVSSIADVLGLNKEDWLKRRLQTIVLNKNLAPAKKARQLITHKHIAVNSKIVNVPSYMVSVDEEDKISLVKKHKVKKAEVKQENEGEIKWVSK